jgi:hypothetical protein
MIELGKLTIFTAASCPLSTARARHTSPIPPFPIDSNSSNCPSFNIVPTRRISRDDSLPHPSVARESDPPDRIDSTRSDHGSVDILRIDD